MDRNARARAALVDELNRKRAERGLPPIHLPDDARSPRRLLAVHTLRRAPKRPGRNQPCPCGSGRKFKKCCGAPPALRPKVVAAPRMPSPIVRPGSLLEGPGAMAADPFGDKLIVTPDDIENLERQRRAQAGPVEIVKK